MSLFLLISKCDNKKNKLYRFITEKRSTNNLLAGSLVEGRTFKHIH